MQKRKTRKRKRAVPERWFRRRDILVATYTVVLGKVLVWRLRNAFTQFRAVG